MTPGYMQKALEISPGQFIVGSNGRNDDDGEDLDDDTQICSCHVCISSWSPVAMTEFLQNVSKGAITKCVKDGLRQLDDIKLKTKAGTGMFLLPDREKAVNI